MKNGYQTVCNTSSPVHVNECKSLNVSEVESIPWTLQHSTAVPESTQHSADAGYVDQLCPVPSSKVQRIVNLFHRAGQALQIQVPPKRLECWFPSRQHKTRPIKMNAIYVL